MRKLSKKLTNKDFEKVIITNGKKLFSLCQFALDEKNKYDITNRKYLGRLNLEATWMEEILDSYGAQYNSTWFPFREGIAAQKLFSSVCYEIIHIKSSIPYYNLLYVEGDFPADVDRILKNFYSAITYISGYILKFLKKQDIEVELESIHPEYFNEIHINSRLDTSRKIRDLQQPEKTLVYLATSFLNLGSDTDILESGKCMKKRDYERCIPDQISEDKLRVIKAHFHNLQSMYDTHLSKTYIESKNSNPHILRGHISIIFHLLRSATDFSHYYERHMFKTRLNFLKNPFLPMSNKKLLSILMEFFLKYSVLYFTAAGSLCRSIISEYAEEGTITVAIPNYRGFHVRPSMLISKIVLHYGIKVRMKMDDEQYDASSTLDLFRANEKINAEKRKHIGQFLESGTLLENFHLCKPVEWPKMLQLVILDLMESEEIILYEKSLSMKDVYPEEMESPEEFFKRVISLFLASGKIDIKSNLKVSFLGDKRVLNDLRILAESGYGEDKYGNNIMLPKELTYLSR